MLIAVIRTMIIYTLVILSIRIMGKRQISELRPSELVVALLISDIAAVPMQDPATPLLYGVIPILLLAALELLLSGIMLKFPAAERLISGNPVPIITNGKIDIQALKKLRLTVDNLMEAMRVQNLFNIEDIAIAIAEANGHITFYPKTAARAVTLGDIRQNPPVEQMPSLIISDGDFCQWGLTLANADPETVNAILQKHRLTAAHVFLMTLTADGQYFIYTDSGEVIQ